MELNFEFFYNLPIERNKKVLMLLRSQETHEQFLDCLSHSAARSVKEKSDKDTRTVFLWMGVFRGSGPRYAENWYLK